jgi:fructan beta-fructosidase
MPRLSKKLLVVFITGVVCVLAEGRYGERYRPQFHFSPQVNWTNDPCGLVYAFGKYHLFFQHNPFANVWGHMSWGHAVSSDLVHWKQLPVAIREDEKAAIFTGSSIFDATNTSGLCQSSRRGCIVSIYTGFTPKTDTAPEKQTQNLAFSQDGLTWTKYARNPVLDLGRSDTRDPKVFWYAPAKYWVMVIVQANDKKVRLFSSSDLKEWRPLSDFGPQGATGGVWECPDLYTLPVQGQAGKMRWILKIGLNPGHISGGSGEQYFIGQFDGKTFTPDEANGAIHWLDYGRDCYCALTFNHEPNPQVPRMIGWMNNWQYAAGVPTSPWRGAMTLPRDLSLANVNGGLQLLQRPIEALRSGFDAAKGQLFVDRSKSAATQFSKAFPSRTVAPLTLGNGPLKLHIFVDRSSVEVFAQDGAVAMTNLVFPKPGSTGLSLAASGGGVENIQFRMWALGSAWRHVQP